jgi:hypothetical protein
MSHEKKLNSFQDFGNIAPDYESPAIKFVRTVLSYLLRIYWQKIEKSTKSPISLTLPFWRKIFSEKLLEGVSN